MNFLLPASTLLQLIGSGDTPAQQWSNSVDSRSLRTSVISVAQANAAIQASPDPAIRARLDADLSALLSHLKADSNVAPMPFSMQHARMWSTLSTDASLAPLHQVDRQVYASSMHEGLTVVEPARPEHPCLKAVGVLIHAL